MRSSDYASFPSEIATTCHAALAGAPENRPSAETDWTRVFGTSFTTPVIDLTAPSALSPVAPTTRPTIPLHHAPAPSTATRATPNRARPMLPLGVSPPVPQTPPTTRRGRVARNIAVLAVSVLVIAAVVFLVEAGNR